MANAAVQTDVQQSQKSATVEHTTCCIVGGGPAGVMLAYLLARRGVHATLLEAHENFDRSFRGDTVHPWTLELLDQLGLAERLLALPHARMQRFGVETPAGKFVLADFSLLRTRFPYVAMIDQSRFLTLLAAEAAAYEAFHLHMNANVREVVEDDGRCVGVQCQTREGLREIRAALVVAADGRHSVLRKKSGLTPIATSAPMDVLWFRLPKIPSDEGLGEGGVRAFGGRLTVTLEREDYWQVALVIPKGGYHELKEQGIDEFRRAVVASIPRFADRVDAVSSWKDVAVLDVESNRLPCWSKPGLLFIGDAAHTMSPVGGMGINYALQDAVVAAKVLAAPLLDGFVPDERLAEVQRRREPSVRVAQAVQSMIQRRIIGRGLADDPGLSPPFPARFRFFRRLAARFIGYGFHPACLAPPPFSPPPGAPDDRPQNPAFERRLHPSTISFDTPSQ